MRLLIVFLAALALLPAVAAHGEEEPREAPRDASAVRSEARRLTEEGVAHHQEGRFVEALNLFEQALEMRRRLFNGDHPEVAASLGNLASCLDGLQQSREALPLHAQVLAMKRRLYEGDHIDIAVGLNNLAYCLEKLGQSSNAEPLFREALEMRARLFEGDDPGVAMSLTNLAWCLGHLGRPSEALRLHRRALDMRVRLFDGAHPDVAMSLNNVAVCLDSLGRPHDALQVHMRALAMNKSLFEGDHAAVAQGLGNLAACLDGMGRWRNALLFHERALEMRKRLFEGDHPDVALSKNNLARCLWRLGRPGEALPHFEQSLATRRRLFEGDHMDVAVGLNNLAACLLDLGRNGAALPLYEQVLAMHRRLFEGDHPNIAANLCNVAGCLHSLRRHGDALGFYEQALAMRRRLFEGDHPDIARSLNGLAFCWENLGRPGAALPLHVQALAMFRRVFEGNHPALAKCLVHLASCLEALGRQGDVLPLYEEALEMRRRLFEGDHPDVAESLDSLAHCQERLGRPRDALVLYEQALTMKMRLSDGDHPRVASAINNLAVCLEGLGRTHDAIIAYEEALRIWRRARSPDRRITATSLALLLLDDPDRCHEAIELLDEAIAQTEILRAEGGALGAAERSSYFRRLRGMSDPYQSMVRVQIRIGDLPMALGYLEQGRSRVLLDLLERGEHDPMALAMAEARAKGDEALRRRLSDVVAGLAEAEEAVSERTHAVALARERQDLDTDARLALVDAASASLIESRRRLEAVLRERGALLRDVIPMTHPATPSEIRAVLAPKERLLVYSVGPDDSMLFVVGPPGETLEALTLKWPEGEDDVTAVALTEAIGAYLYGMGVRDDAVRGPLRPAAGASPEHATGERLFHALLPPDVWEEVLAAPRVYVVPHGRLHRLPFETLVVDTDAEGGPRYVLDAAPPITYAPSGSVLLWCHEHRAAQRRADPSLEVVALGDPVYSPIEGAGRTWPAHGALVCGVVADGTALAAGVLIGDVVVEYDGTDIADHLALREAQRGVGAAIADGERAPGPLPITVWRRGQRVTLVVPPGKLGVEVAEGSPATAARELGAGKTPDVVSRGLAASIRGGLTPLPGTRREVEGIVRAFAATPAGRPACRVVSLLGPEATEPRLFALAPRARYLHLGTHGLVDERERASYSALALTLPPFATPEDDGFLTLFDLFEHWRDRLSGCELAVLSACRTQRGPLSRHEGVFALSWGLHYAGCPAVVASLWSVSDESTALLMQDLYARLAKEPSVDKLEAFTAARKTLRKTHPQPFHWAPFIYIGDPR